MSDVVLAPSLQPQGAKVVAWNTITFLYLVFCHKFYINYCHAFMQLTLKIWGQLSKNCQSYAIFYFNILSYAQATTLLQNSKLQSIVM